MQKEWREEPKKSVKEREIEEWRKNGQMDRTTRRDTALNNNMDIQIFFHVFLFLHPLENGEQKFQTV